MEAMEKRKKAGGESSLGLWLDFVWECKGALLLYGLTVFLFMAVGALYRMEQVSRLLYAIPLSAFFWLAAGFFAGKRYVAKRRELLLAGENLEQLGTVEWNPDLWREKRKPLEGAYEGLIEAMEELRKRKQSLEEEAQTARGDYYLMWAHQIKTPIAAMKLLLGGETIGSRERFLLKEELFKTEQYVEMVLHYQRLESMGQDLVLQECDLYTLLKQAVKKYAVLFINKGIRLQLSEMRLSVLTDEKWLGFCIEQILSNSIKYTAPATGCISIYLWEQEPHTLVVEDNGIGIRPEDLPRIFERGFTGYNGRMDKKSTGIGLYLCRQILDRLGNQIRVESRENQGTRVYLSLYQTKENKD